MCAEKLATVSRRGNGAVGPIDHFERSSINFFTTHLLDRLSTKRQDLMWTEELLENGSTMLVPVLQSKNLFRNGDSVEPVFFKNSEVEGLLSKAESAIFLGIQKGRAYFALGLPHDDEQIAEVFAQYGQFKDLKAMGPLLNRHEAALLAYSRAMVHWHRRNRFCGDCGSPTAIADSGHRRICTSRECGQQHFPRTDPAIIVLVTSRDKCLLGRQKVWPEGFYSTIAGFVEPGESLEEAVVREVSEETSIRIKEIHYHSSQPWPFPSSIMLGFTATAESERIELGDHELEDARWFTPDEIQQALREGRLRLPTRISIAYRLIEGWYDANGPLPLSSVLKSIGKS